METLWQDLRYGARMLTRNPGFTAVAVLTLALGIGANTALFSVIDAVLLRPLPYADSDELVVVWESHDGERNSISIPNFDDWRDQNRVFSHIALFRGRNYNLTGTDQPERLRAGVASGSFFRLLGVEPLLGRAFQPKDDRAGAERVVVLSYGLWHRRFASDPAVVGQAITLDGDLHTVIGVMPPGFRHPDIDRAQMWLPVSFDTQYMLARESRGNHSYQAVARLAPGVSLPQARAEMQTIARRLEQDHPDSNTGTGALVFPLLEELVENVRPALLVLLAGVGLVLLIACANLTNLLLARAAGREKEIAIRAALGAGRTRLLRQLLTESLLLAVLGGLLGVLLALWGVDLLVRLAPGNIPRLEQVGINAPVLGFTLLLSLATGLFFGLAPALQSSRPDLHHSLKEGGRTSAAAGRRRLRSLLVVAEVALSLMLLIGAGLLLRSFVRLLDVNLGFQPANVLTARVSLPDAAYPEDEDVAAFQQEVLRRLESLPGVHSAGLVTPLPLSGAQIAVGITIEGKPEPPPGEGPYARFRSVGGDYFRTLGIPLLRGRAFTSADTQAAPRVAVINQTLARLNWPGEDPLGKRVAIGDPAEGAPWRTVVGLVPDVKYRSLEHEPEPEMYVPGAQSPMDWIYFVVRTEGDPVSLAPALRQQIASLDPNLPVFAVGTLEQLVTRSVGQRRFTMLLLGSFAALALLLAVVGIYGVMSYAVSRRTHEIGIRVALGAQRDDILKLVGGQGMALALLGVGLGLAGAFAVTRFLSSLLFGITPTDPLTFAGVAFVLAAVALLACYLPARRATRVDPMVALRYE